MQNFLLLITFQLVCGFAFVQEPVQLNPIVEAPEKVIYDIVDEPAEFPGGRDALIKYLSNNIVYPKEAQKKKIQGKCYLRFVVSDTGKVEHVKVKKGVTDCPECDQEAVKAIERMPLWTPGKVQGKNVNSMFSLPVSFKL